MNMYKDSVMSRRPALFRFYLQKIDVRIIFVLIGLFIIITVYGIAAMGSLSYFDPETGREALLKGNIWRSMYSLFADNIFFPIPLFLISMYCAYCICKNDSFEDTAKIRSGSYQKYIHAKLLLLLGINTATSIGAFLLALLISSFFFDIQWSWNPEFMEWVSYMRFYSVWRFSGITMVTYISVLTCLSYIFGIALTKIRHHVIIPFAILIYLIFQSVISQLDPAINWIKIVKLFCMNTYLMIGERKLFAGVNLYEYSFLTVSVGVVVPLAALLFIYTAILLGLKLKFLQEG